MGAHTHKHANTCRFYMYAHTHKQANTQVLYECINMQTSKHTQVLHMYTYTTNKQTQTGKEQGRGRKSKHSREFSLSSVVVPLGRQNYVRLADCSKLHAKSKLGLAISNLGSCHFYTQEVPILGPAFVSVAQFMCIIAFPKSPLGLLFLGNCGRGSYRHG